MQTPELVDELCLARQEAERLAEMIAVLGGSIDGSKLQQLHAELQSAKRRAAQLADEVARGAAQACAVGCQTDIA